MNASTELLRIVTITAERIRPPLTPAGAMERVENY